MAGTSFHTVRFAIAGIALCVPAIAQPTSFYYRHAVFDNSLEPRGYHHSRGTVSAPSDLKLESGALPVDSENFKTPPNALKMEWRSVPGGFWEAEVRLDRWRNRPPLMEGDTLRFWVFAQQPAKGDQLPLVQLRDSETGFTAPVPFFTGTQELPARRWVEIRIPLRSFRSISFRLFTPGRLASVFFLQNGTDGEERTITIDEIRMDFAEESEPGRIAPPANLRAKGYDSHIDLTWTKEPRDGIERHVVYRSLDGWEFRPIGIQLAGFNRYTDYLGAPDRKATYKVTASGRNYTESAYSEEASASTRAFNDEELLTMMQEANFRYYWDGAHYTAGMAVENIPGDDNIVATGASGFGVMALIVGAERGFITREQATARLLKIIGFLEKADCYHGVWPHFLDGRTGRTVALFGKYDNGADLVETSFLIQGLLAARQYFRNDGEAGRELHDRITRLWEGVDWQWHRRSPNGDYLFWHWSPLYAWRINHRLIGFNETMITYLAHWLLFPTRRKHRWKL